MAAALEIAASLSESSSCREAPSSTRAGRHTVAPLGLADDPRLLGLSAAAVGLYPWLLLLRQQWVIRGLSVLRGTSVEAVLAAEIPLPEIAAGLAELERAGLVLVDRAARVLYVPAAQSLTAQAPSNVRQVEQLAQQVAGLPSSAVVERAKDDLLALCERAEPDRARHRGRQIVDKTLLERVREALGVRLRSLPEIEEQAGQLTLPGMAIVTETPDFIDFELACEPVTPLREGAPSQSVAKRAAGAPLSILSGGHDADCRGSDLGASDGTSDAASAPGACAADPGAPRVGQRRDGAGLRLVGDVGASAGVRAPAAAVSTLGSTWRAVTERCPQLAGACGITDTGLSHKQEAQLARDCRDSKLSRDDLLLVADYVNAGGFGWAGSGARERVLSDPAEAVAQARQWDAAGRGAVSKRGVDKPQNLKPSAGWGSESPTTGKGGW